MKIYSYRYLPIQTSFSSNLKQDQWISANIHKRVFSLSVFFWQCMQIYFLKMGASFITTLLFIVSLRPMVV